jgi:hypothetical protein
MSSKKSKSSKSTNNKSTTPTSNAKGVKVTKTRTVAGHVPASEQCEHTSAKHHSKGKCVMCYNAARNKKKSSTKTTRKPAARKLAA